MALLSQLPGPLTLFNFVYLFTYCLGEDILGCGGFVKSDLDINLSQVEVKLYTKQGSLKDHTDCAPNNGYYFLPFYDKGEYILKIEPPSGWSFKPKEVALNIDGVTDPCSQGKDINFVLLGFAVKGKVLSLGSESGPKNVKVSLYHESPAGLKLTAETLTGDDGSYLLTPVLPGKYTLKIHHDKWQLAPNSVTLQVKSGNTVVEDNSLVVGGYDVSGEVTSDGEAIRGVSFLLFQKEKTWPAPVLEGCSKSLLSGLEGKAGMLCHVASDERGQFVFPSVPPGSYIVVPHYEGSQSVQFDVQPKQMVFTVKHDSVRITTPFQVTGFSVSGRVLASPGGNGLEAAAVFLDGKLAANTRPDGTYVLENLKAGSYKIQVQAKNMRFEEAVVKISPNTPLLPALHPSAFRVCGRVLPYQYQQAVGSATEQAVGGATEQAAKLVVVSRDGSATSPDTVEAKAGTGEFCLMMEPGKYEAKVEVTEQDKNRGLQFFPVGLVINVKDRPILTGIEFSQLKVKLSGEMVCLSQPCPSMTVTLQLITSEKEKISGGSVSVTNGKYTFEQLLPATYQVTVEKDDWCWETPSHVITVSSIQSTAPTFKQTGYAITIISSHDIQVSYKKVLPSTDEKTPAESPVSGQQLAKRGATKFCVSQPGDYQLRPLGCHGYTHDTHAWSSRASDKPVALTAVAHTLGGRVVADVLVDDLYVSVKLAADNKLKARLGPLRGELKDGKYMYSFKLLLLEGENVYLEPTAGLLLFEPTKVSVEGGGDCVENGVHFAAAKGKLVEGKMLPKSAGIAVTISNADGDVIVVTETDSEGAFRVGPLPGNVNYRVSAEKEGYVITGPDKYNNFKLHKLAQIDVTVTDKADGKALQGVLLSLSGGDSFRRNSQTNSDGSMTFTSLSPGEYYLRPMMKEYKFEPSSRMITVDEGATLGVKLTGRRVAFSAFGSVTSLNGEPEDGVVVEAVGQGSCPQQEESTTEATGQFRVRGLQPGCEYLIRVKQGAGVNLHVQKGSAAGVTVKVTGDMKDVKLLALQRLTHMDLTAHVTAPSLDHLKTLRVKLCREDIPDSPIHVMKLWDAAGASKPTPFAHPATLLLFPTVPIDNRSYFLQLESTLPKATHAFSDHVVHFKANTSFKHVNLVFTPEQKMSDQDLAQSSYLALVVLAMLVGLYFNKEKIGPSLLALKSSLNGGVTVTPSNVKRRGSGGEAMERETEAVAMESASNVNKRKVKSRKT